MGKLVVTIGVGDQQGRQFEDLEVIVDTWSTFTAAWSMVLAPARRSSVTSRSWKVSNIRSTRPLACGERAKICWTPSARITPGELGGFDRHRLLTGVVLECGVAVAVEGQGNSTLADQTLQEHQVAAGVLGGAEDGLGHGAGGVVHRDEQRQLGPPVLQPGVLAAVDLHQHPLLGHATAPEPVLLEAAAARTADAGPDQNPAHRRAAQVDALPFPQQLGEVAVAGAGVAVAGQLHHGSGGRLGDGVVGLSAPVPVGQRGSTVLAVTGEETLGVTFTHSHDLGGLGDGKLVFQNTVEHLNPGLFLLIQLYIPHRDDIVADQLAGDRIVDHQQVNQGH